MRFPFRPWGSRSVATRPPGPGAQDRPRIRRSWPSRSDASSPRSIVSGSSRRRSAARGVARWVGCFAGPTTRREVGLRLAGLVRPVQFRHVVNPQIQPISRGSKAIGTRFLIEVGRMRQVPRCRPFARRAISSSPVAQSMIKSPARASSARRSKSRASSARRFSKYEPLDEYDMAGLVRLPFGRFDNRLDTAAGCLRPYVSSYLGSSRSRR